MLVLEREKKNNECIMPISFIILHDFPFTTTINCMTDFSDNNHVLNVFPSNMNIGFSRSDDGGRGRGGEGVRTHFF